MSLENILKFSTFLTKFREVERVVFVNKQDRDENDAEHSYMLAMLAWYIVSSEKVDLDIDKVIRYALVHDLVETYAGDTYFYSQQKEGVADLKVQKEHESFERIKLELSEFPNMLEAISDYEARENDESKFVYALDKIQPIIQIYLDGGRSWRRDKVTIDMLESMKKEKVALSPKIEGYFKEIVTLLKKEKSMLWH